MQKNFLIKDSYNFLYFFGLFFSICSSLIQAPCALPYNDIATDAIEANLPSTKIPCPTPFFPSKWIRNLSLSATQESTAALLTCSAAIGSIQVISSDKKI